MGRLIRIERYRWKGQVYEMHIIQCTEDHYMARTWLAAGDCIVTDGKSEDEALRMHLEVLPDTGADVCEVFESV